MEGGGEGVAPATSRIFLGGLGNTVTANDIVRTFSSLGQVHGVEIIRTKGRCFAYMDFNPSSQKALDKLFSSYNGCTWKGGKLRLEKAKEHYLACLKREWVEDAEQEMIKNANLDNDKPIDTPIKSKVLIKEKPGLKIFFPKVKRVKVLPFAGTGKHKYSFPRMTTPPLPLHFYDCEVHSKAHDTETQSGHLNRVEQNGGINEEELSIMNSVMDRLFGHEAASKSITGGSNSTIEAKDIKPLDNDDIELEDEEEEDPDCLVTNITIEGERNQLDSVLRDGWGVVPSNQFQASSSQNLNPVVQDGQEKIKGNFKSQKTTKPIASSVDVTRHQFKRKSSSKEEDDDKELGSVQKKNKRTSENHSHEEDQNEEAPTTAIVSQSDRNADINANGNSHANTNADAHVDEKMNKNINGPPAPESINRSWMQKSSWKDLVGDKPSFSFRLSDVIPGVALSETKELPRPYKSKTLFRKKDNKTINKGIGSLEGNGTLKSKGVGMVNNFTQNSSAKEVGMMHNSKENASNAGDRLRTDLKSGKNSLSEVKMGVETMGGGEVCTFMRSAKSEREWVKAKAAVSGSIKTRKTRGNYKQ
ncbi:hypothetical protein AMTRI_Chr01g136250 [Amborella trichopoda]